MKPHSCLAGHRCDGVSRRDFLHLGLATAFGFSLADWMRVEAAGTGLAVRGAARTKSCILIWLDGGPSHLDTFDPKPEAASEIRGPFGAISSRVADIRLCEHLPRTAAVMDQVTLIRSITHELGNHDTGTRFLLTGHRPTPALDYPSLGSIVAHECGQSAETPMPPYIAIPGDAVGGDSGGARAGYLPAACSAFSVGKDPSRVRDLEPLEGISFARTERRREMLERMDAWSREVEEGPTTRNRDAFFAQAYRLLASPEAKAAFDVSREAPGTRERFGPSRIGTGCLLARRLVEAGSRLVTVVDSGWDTHQNIAVELPDARFAGSGKLPSLDRAYSALITDLRERGLLETTLVVLMGEFGRTPKLNSLGGRDHWPRAGFACLAGGGIRGGQVIGATDSSGEVPVERPVGPPDLMFSLLTQMGIDPRKELRTPAGRPVKILDEGDWIAGLT